MAFIDGLDRFIENTGWLIIATAAIALVAAYIYDQIKDKPK